MTRVSLRSRFVAVVALLVATTVASGTWSAFTFARLSRVVGGAMLDTEETTGATSALASTLEREDDALLLCLNGDPAGARDALVGERRLVAASFARLDALRVTSPERLLAASLGRSVEAYHAAGDALLATPPGAAARDRYHREVNPLLRLAVATAARMRDEHLRSTQQVAAYARDETRQATSMVVSISAAALLVSVLAAFHLAQVVIWPLRELTRGVEAIRRGNFNRRLRPRSTDEVGRLAEGFNRMAEDLAEFRRTNVGEVLRAKETLESTLAALPDAVIVVDPDGRVASLNGAARAVLAATGAPPARIEDLPLPAAARRALRDALDGAGGPEAAVDLARALTVSLEGGERKLLPRVVPVRGFASDRHGAVLVLVDVTELVRLDEMRVELVAVASHELRTPLTTMRMTLLMLGEGAAGLPPRQQDLIATALLGVEQLASTVDEFLDLTRVEAGQLRLTWDRVDVAALVGTALRAARGRCEEAGVELRHELDDRVTAVWGDAARLQAVLANLLTNALKYTPHGGSVGVRVSLQEAGEGAPARLQIAVTDSGSGVPEELRERVFEKFFRVEHLRRTEEGGVRGAGIGLYLSRQIVEAHGGRIRCEAGEGGKGTTITLALPVDRDPPSSPSGG